MSLMVSTKKRKNHLVFTMWYAVTLTGWWNSTCPRLWFFASDSIMSCFSMHDSFHCINSPTSSLFQLWLRQLIAQYKSLPLYPMGVFWNVVSVIQKLFWLTLLYSAEHQPLAHLLAWLVILFSKGNITGGNLCRKRKWLFWWVKYRQF